MKMSGKLLLEGGTDCADYEWEDLTYEFTMLMKKRNPSLWWDAKVKNFGWLSKKGIREGFEATTGQELLRAILPRTSCSFKIYSFRKTGFAINNAHHDSPVWAEWYYITKGVKR